MYPVLNGLYTRLGLRVFCEMVSSWQVCCFGVMSGSKFVLHVQRHEKVEKSIAFAVGP